MKVLYISLSVFIIDQFSKLAVKGISIPFLNIDWNGMFYGESIEIIGTFLRITFVENPGMAFGFEVGVIQKLFLSIFTFTVFGFLKSSLLIIVLANVAISTSLSSKDEINLSIIVGSSIGSSP